MERLRAYVREEPWEALWLLLMALGWIDLAALLIVA